MSTGAWIVMCVVSAGIGFMFGYVVGAPDPRAIDKKERR